MNNKTFDSLPHQDYQTILKSLTDAAPSLKAQLLQKLIQLIKQNQTQFLFYAKRLIHILQQLLTQSQADLNILASNLTLQILNLHPKDIQFYTRNKLLRNLIKNLGDSNPNVRKLSHLCLVQYLRMYRSFTELIPHYINEGLCSNTWQLKQKSINSFQSLLIMEIKYLSWNSVQFRKMFEILIQKLNDESPYVQKASEQCLISLCKDQNIKILSKRLSPIYLNLLKIFLDLQYKNGIIKQIKIDQNTKQTKFQNNLKKSLSTIQNQNQPKLSSLPKFTKVEVQDYEVIKIDSPEKTIQMFDSNNLRSNDKKIITRYDERLSHINYSQNQQINQNNKFKRNRSNTIGKIDQSIEKSLQLKNKGLNKIDDILRQNNRYKYKGIQQLQNRVSQLLENGQLQHHIIQMIGVFDKLLNDHKTKVNNSILRIIKMILKYKNQKVNQIIYPIIIAKLGDKIQVKQSIIKLIKQQLLQTNKKSCLENLVSFMKNTENITIIEEIVNILFDYFFQQNQTDYNQQLLNNLCDNLQDGKSKVKLKILDLLVTLIRKSDCKQKILKYIQNKVKKVYYEMIMQKIGKNNKRSDNDKSSIELRMSRQTKQQMTKNRSTAASQKINYESFNNSTHKVSLTQHSQLKRKSYSGLQQNKYTISTEKPSNIQDADYKSIPILSNPHQIKSHKINKKKTSIQLYIPVQQLTQLDNPHKQFKNIVQQLNSPHWQISFQAINKFRKIVKYNKQLIQSNNIRNIIQALLASVDSLRSTLSKNAILALNELINQAKKQIDSELDFIFPYLIKKTMDTNSFILQQVKKTLLSLSINCNECKIMNLLMGYYNSKSIAIKYGIINIIQTVAFINRYQQKQFQKILIILNKFLNQGALQIRIKSQQIILKLLESNKATLVQKIIGTEKINKIKKKQSVNYPQSSIQVSLPKITTISTQFNKKSKIKYIKGNKTTKILSSFPKQLQNLQIFLHKCDSNEWKQRLQAMKQISILIHKFPIQITQHKIHSKIIDQISKQINDPNLKVATNAFPILSSLIQNVTPIIQSNINIVTTQIFNCFGSSKQQIRNQGQLLFNTLYQYIQSMSLFQYLCNGALYSIQKARPVIIKKLIEILQDIYIKKPFVFIKTIQKTIQKLIEETKPQIVFMVSKLIRKSQEIVGHQIFVNIKEKIKLFMA